MYCLYCGSDKTYVIDTRMSNTIRRRRYECRVCGKRFTTFEDYAKYFDKTSKKKIKLPPKLVSIAAKLKRERGL